MKIALIGEYYSYNLGEPLLFACCESIIKELDYSVEVEKLDFFGRTSREDKFKEKGGVWGLHFGVRVIRKLCKMAGLTTIILDEWEWKLGKDKKRLEKFFQEKFKQGNYDGIIIMGAGTLKYDVRLNFEPYYRIVVKTAERLHIPVYINCVGVESRFNPSDRRCMKFQECLSSSAVKIITTRDDLDTLKKYVKNPETQVDKIADIGVWAAETYGMKKAASAECVGLGMITPERFREFGRKAVYQKYEKLWMEIIRELDRKNVAWKIFNNGDTCDAAFAEKLCALAGKPVEEYVITPENPKELVETISRFRGIITSRLHSCIVAYSLNIPFVAISWNNKLQFFGREIRVPERIIGETELDKTIILDKFNRALEEGYDMEFRNKFRETSREAIRSYLESIRAIKAVLSEEGDEKL